MGEVILKRQQNRLVSLIHANTKMVILLLLLLMMMVIIIIVIVIMLIISLCVIARQFRDI